MATRIRIAAAACVVVSGLFVGGAGAAVALADSEAGQSGETVGTPTDLTDVGTTAPTSGQALEEATTDPAPAAMPTGTAPKPPSHVGDGRNGLPSGDRETTQGAESTSKRSLAAGTTPRQTDPTGTGEPTSSTKMTTTATTTTTPVGPTKENPPPSKDNPDEHQWWHWPWCWPTPKDPGQPPGSGRPPSSGGGGGGVSMGKPPLAIGIPQPPPLMQLPVASLPTVVPPTLPVISVDPATDVISGLATAAAELPFTPLTLPVIVPPLGPGIAPRPGSPTAPKTSGSPQNKSQPPKAGGQNPPAYSASNGQMPASYRAGYGDYLRTAGVGQIAAVAVPGVTGILVLTGAGGVLGYRQARAGHAVRANGTARFMG